MELNTSYIDLSRGFPDPKIFPSEEIKEILREINYDVVNTEGKIEGIDEAIYYLLKIRGIGFEFNLATSTMEVINNIISSSTVACEEPSHDGIIMKPGVMSYEGLVAKGKWKFSGKYFYFSIVNNPTGVVAKGKKLEEFREEAKNKGIKIILDDVYGYFSDTKAFFDENTTIYVSSLSRILGSGLRIAFTNAKTKSRPSSISQYIVKRLYESGVLQSIIEKEKRVYSERLKKASEFFEKYLYKKPEGGVSLLLTLQKERFNAIVSDGSRYFKRKVNFTRITISRYDISEIMKVVKLD